MRAYEFVFLIAFMGLTVREWIGFLSEPSLINACYVGLALLGIWITLALDDGDTDRCIKKLHFLGRL